jgi:hypothetical protein
MAATKEVCASAGEAPQGENERVAGSAGLGVGGNSQGLGRVAEGAPSEGAGAPLLAATSRADAWRARAEGLAVVRLFCSETSSTSEKVVTTRSEPLPAASCAPGFREDVVVSVLAIGVVFETSTMGSVGSPQDQGKRETRMGASRSAGGARKYLKIRGLQKH